MTTCLGDRPSRSAGKIPGGGTPCATPCSPLRSPTSLGDAGPEAEIVRPTKDERANASHIGALRRVVGTLAIEVNQESICALEILENPMRTKATVLQSTSLSIRERLRDHLKRVLVNHVSNPRPERVMQNVWSY